MKYEATNDGKPYNSPKSYQFFRLEYRRANILLSDKINF